TDVREAAGEPDDIATEPPFEASVVEDALMVDLTPVSDFDPTLETVAEAMWAPPAEFEDEAAIGDTTEQLPEPFEAVWVEAEI
ncbi:hypothetical protein NY549_07905, partial [Enterobacter hormaechei]|uniref:hypothetical protein n=1 Tax=Enterobacter hormaechei TaxID=158836 RepID=UPI0022F05CDB